MPEPRQTGESPEEIARRIARGVVPEFNVPIAMETDWRGALAGEIADALVAATAEGRRQGIEGAARLLLNAANMCAMRGNRELASEALMKAVDAIRALAASPAGGEADGWRPMSEAPKDGTPVDLWHPAHGRSTDARFDAVDGVWCTRGSLIGDDAEFTAWRPLPPPPAGQRD